MRVEINEEPITALAEYATIPIAFEVATVFDVVDQADEESGMLRGELPSNVNVPGWPYPWFLPKGMERHGKTISSPVRHISNDGADCWVYIAGASADNHKRTTLSPNKRGASSRRLR